MALHACPVHGAASADESPVVAISDASGVEARVDDAGFRVRWRGGSWEFAGPMPGQTRGERQGRDAYGPYREAYAVTDAKDEAALRVYRGRAVITFRRRVADAAAAHEPFPRFTRWPRDKRGMSFTRKEFAPLRFDWEGDAPWVFRDAQGDGAAVLAPDSQVMTSGIARAADGSLSVGLEPAVARPHGPLATSAALAFGAGVNEAFDAWGSATRAWAGRPALANDASRALATLGYWTDNRASYWYNYVSALGYEGTLLGVARQFAAHGIPLGYMQLDSWWYTKGGDPDARPPYGPSWRSRNYRHGIHEYRAAPEIFPRGLADFQARLGLPLVTHARWISLRSPYAREYALSRQIPADPRYWEMVMAYLAAGGVQTYEQDWLSEKALPRLDRLGEAEGVFDAMAAAAARHGLSLQYCMPLARHFLLGARYPNLETIRVSGDGFERGKWTAFLLGSRLAAAVGIWPFSDVVFSRDRASLLLATLSGGMVGLGDRYEGGQGDENTRWCGKELRCTTLAVANARRVIRADGVVVKPDTPLLPLDASYDAAAGRGSGRAMVAASRSTGAAGTQAAYVFAYAMDPGADVDAEASLAELGITGPAYVLDDATGELQRAPRDGRVKLRAAGSGSYYVVVPAREGGFALLGDLERFVPLGRQRIRLKAEDGAGHAYAVTLAAGELAVRLSGIAPARAVTVVGEGGRARLVTRDAATGRFVVEVARDGDDGAATEAEVGVRFTP